MTCCMTSTDDSLLFGWNGDVWCPMLVFQYRVNLECLKSVGKKLVDWE